MAFSKGGKTNVKIIIGASLMCAMYVGRHMVTRGI